MDEKQARERIAFQGKFFVVTPVVKGGVRVQEILAQMALGKSVETILEEHPGLERDDVLACLAHAAGQVARERRETLRDLGWVALMAAPTIGLAIMWLFGH